MSFLFRFSVGPWKLHYDGAKSILAYLLPNKDYKLTYTDDGIEHFRKYSDVSYANTPEAKSTYDHEVFYSSTPNPC